MKELCEVVNHELESSTRLRVRAGSVLMSRRGCELVEEHHHRRIDQGHGLAAAKRGAYDVQSESVV